MPTPPESPDEPISGFGILLAFGDRNLLQANDISGAASQGIRVTADFGPDATVTAADNVVRDNQVERTGLDGILVDATATGSLLKRNRAFGADDDGIDVESPTTTLTRNTASHNGDLGIEAVAGVTDGGGNRAPGQRQPAAMPERVLPVAASAPITKSPAAPPPAAALTLRRSARGYSAGRSVR